MENANWNLEDLFKKQNDVDEFVDTIKQKAESFSNIYKGNLKNIQSTDFLEAIKCYENVHESLAKVLTYAYLRFATDSNLGSYLAKYQEIYTDINENIIFFELEFNRLPKAKQDEFISASKEYEYYLISIQKTKPHQLSQKEERIMLKTSILGSSAFARLFDEHFSTLSFMLDNKKYSEEKILSMLYSPDREIRKKASISLTKGLKPHQKLFSYIFNMIKKDLSLTCELRKYKNPELPRHEENKISKKSVDSLIKSVEKEFGIVHEYYTIKKHILGLDVLYDYDRYAPLSQDEQSLKFDEAKKIVLKTFNDFSPNFGSIAKRAFDENWIDIYPKVRKRSGAFSHPAVSSAHPYVLLNYTDKRRDLFTLAHELGHAIHQQLSYSVGYLGSDTPLTTAETASVFAEMMVYDNIKDTLGKDEKIAMLAGKLEDIFATLFRQINFTTFERRIHSHEGEVSSEKFNQYWMEENRKMFGESVILTNNYELWWSYIPHFIHSPFYCYAYSYGQLLVLALYGLYKSGKNKDFVKIYTKFLAYGGSKSPQELVGMFGFDIEDEAFWRIGIDEVKKMLEEFKGLVNA